MQLAQSVSRAAGAFRRAEGAVAAYGNGSEDAEAAYNEAAEALTEFLEADAALHPPTGASSSSTTGVGRGAASLGLEVYRDFVKGKGKGKTSATAEDESAERSGESGPEEDPEDEDYEEQIEEEEEGDEGDNEPSVEVELAVIPEESHGEGHGDPDYTNDEEAVPEEHD